MAESKHLIRYVVATNPLVDCIVVKVSLTISHSRQFISSSCVSKLYSIIYCMVKSYWWNLRFLHNCPRALDTQKINKTWQYKTKYAPRSTVLKLSPSLSLSLSPLSLSLSLSDIPGNYQSCFHRRFCTEVYNLDALNARWHNSCRRRCWCKRNC